MRLIVLQHRYKIKVIIMEPEQLFRCSLITLLNEYLSAQIEIVKVVTSLADVKKYQIQHGAVDVVLTEAFGVRENYHHWCQFTEFLLAYFPETYCFVWSSKPTMFLRKFTPQSFIGKASQLDKRIGKNAFLRAFAARLNENNDFSANAALFCGPAVSSLTCSEIMVISGIIEGKSVAELSAMYKVNFKTISAHKRKAMAKMRVNTMLQLRSLLIDDFTLTHCGSRPFPVREVTHVAVPI